MIARRTRSEEVVATLHYVDRDMDTACSRVLVRMLSYETRAKA